MELVNAARGEHKSIIPAKERGIALNVGERLNGYGMEPQLGSGSDGSRYQWITESQSVLLLSLPSPFSSAKHERGSACHNRALSCMIKAGAQGETPGYSTNLLGAVQWKDVAPRWQRHGFDSHHRGIIRGNHAHQPRFPQEESKAT